MAINIVESTNFRKKDGKKILVRTSKSYINKNTLEIVPELPEEAVAAEWGEIHGRVRKEETGEVYEIAHDLEDSAYNYVEVFPTPESYCEIRALAYASWDFDMYPTYAPTKTYSEGDIVVYNNWEWISEMNDNTGNIPNNGIGWTEYLPYIETRDVTWKTLEELAEEG